MLSSRSLRLFFEEFAATFFVVWSSLCSFFLITILGLVLKRNFFFAKPSSSYHTDFSFSGCASARLFSRCSSLLQFSFESLVLFVISNGFGKSTNFPSNLWCPIWSVATPYPTRFSKYCVIHLFSIFLSLLLSRRWDCRWHNSAKCHHEVNPFQSSSSEMILFEKKNVFFFFCKKNLHL